MKCDSLDVVKVAKRHHYFLSTNIADFDLVYLLYNIIRELPNIPLFTHVKGH